MLADQVIDFLPGPLFSYLFAASRGVGEVQLEDHVTGGISACADNLEDEPLCASGASPVKHE